MAVRIMRVFGCPRLFGPFPVYLLRGFLSVIVIIQAGAKKPTNSVQYTCPKKNIGGLFVAIHDKKNETTGHQDEGDTSYDLAAESVSVFASKLRIYCLDNEDREGFAYSFIEFENFRAENDPELLMTRHELRVSFIVQFSHIGLTEGGAYIATT